MTDERAVMYARIQQCGGVLDLSSRTKLNVKGNDRVRFLNGQVSNDVRKCRDQISLHACVMTAKGKISADIFVSATDEALRVDSEPEMRASLSARLERYIISDDVFIEDATDTEGLLHVIGGADIESSLPHTVKRFHANRLGVEGLDLVGEGAATTTLLRKLRPELAIIDDEMADLIRIERGVPKWNRELDENTIPVEAGLERTAIDYQKGCYIGQEVISRLRSIGHVNRQLHGIVGLEGTPLAAGMRLVSAVDQAPIGTLTSAAFSFTLEKWIALGYVKRGRAETPSAMATDGEKTEKVKLTELPFIS